MIGDINEEKQNASWSFDTSYLNMKNKLRVWFGVVIFTD